MNRSPGLFSIAAALSVTLLVACAPALAASATLGYDDARHLLARTGFGPTDAEVRAYVGLTRDAAVDRLLRETQTVATSTPPASATDTSPLRPPRGDATEAERKAFVRAQVQEGLALRAWWLREMTVTRSPLTERMTLFWHNHFVSAQPKVRTTRLMYWQNATLRANALGDFGVLLHAIAKDPAMLVYLDGVRNRKGAPNENFAREVMELFTLGEGHYTEQDVREAARAFTGWSLDRETGRYTFRPALHDYGVARRARGAQGERKALRHRHQHREHGHDQRDPGHGQQRHLPAVPHVAHVVGEGKSHQTVLSISVMRER